MERHVEGQTGGEPVSAVRVLAGPMGGDVGPGSVFEVGQGKAFQSDPPAKTETRKAVIRRLSR